MLTGRPKEAFHSQMLRWKVGQHGHLSSTAPSLLQLLSSSFSLFAPTHSSAGGSCCGREFLGRSWTPKPHRQVLPSSTTLQMLLSWDQILATPSLVAFLGSHPGPALVWQTFPSRWMTKQFHPRACNQVRLRNANCSGPGVVSPLRNPGYWLRNLSYFSSLELMQVGPSGD